MTDKGQHVGVNIYLREIEVYTFCVYVHGRKLGNEWFGEHYDIIVYERKDSHRHLM